MVLPVSPPRAGALIHPDARIHRTAMIEPGVTVGAGTAVWDNVHIRRDASIGEGCIIGEKTYIAYEVEIGSRVKINASVYVCAAVTIDDGVMISAGTIFTNDRFPRATTPDLKQLRPSDPDEETLPTRVREGATIGAGCIIGCDLEIGRFAMIGMGAVVTRPVGEFQLVFGNPARLIGFVCACGQKTGDAPGAESPEEEQMTCPRCKKVYRRHGVTVAEV